jgi:hypothetical protein
VFWATSRTSEQWPLQTKRVVFLSHSLWKSLHSCPSGSTKRSGKCDIDPVGCWVSSTSPLHSEQQPSYS